MIHDHVQNRHSRHAHHHAVGQPHPAQVAAWSLLRMSLTVRLAIAAVLSASLWAIVLLVMR